MKITESKLREMIRGVIREFTSSGTAVGAKRGGYQSSDTKTKSIDYTTKTADYDTKSTDLTTKKSDYTTKQSTYNTKKASREFADGQKYRKRHRGAWIHRSAAQGTAPGYSESPLWTAAKAAEDSAEADRDTTIYEGRSASTITVIEIGA